MEQQKITLEEVYRRLISLENAVQIQKLSALSSSTSHFPNETQEDWGEIKVFADNKLLEQAWSGPEEDEAWKDL